MIPEAVEAEGWRLETVGLGCTSLEAIGTEGQRFWRLLEMRPWNGRTGRL